MKLNISTSMIVINDKPTIENIFDIPPEEDPPLLLLPPALLPNPLPPKP